MDEAKVPDEVAYDPYKLLLYKKAIRKGKERENTLRINIIGNYAQGKTSLANRLVGKTCDGVISTNGIEINRFKCQTSDNGNHTLAPFENENQDIVNRVATVARSIEQTIKLDRGETKDYSQQTTLRKENSHDQAQPLETKHHVPTKAVASKIDDVENFVHPESMRIDIPEVKKKKSMSLTFEEMRTFSDVVEVQKDKPAKFIDIWDFGGQYIFYATHTLFHSRKALYLLVFDLTKSLDKIVKDEEEFPGETGDRNMEYFARFWMESIHAYTGPDTKVILVGTHKDKLQGNVQLQNEYFEKIRCLFEGTELMYHFQTKDFAVDNYDNSDPEIANLLEFILKIHEEQVHPVEIPARWIQLEKALREKKRPIISFQDVIELDKHTEYPLLDEEQLKLFLHYHHEKGTLFFYDEDKLSDFICLCPKFLIDAFKCIITSKQFYQNHPDIRSLWQTLSEEGRLEHCLIDKVWSDKIEKSESKPNFKKHKNAILGFLKKQNIISEIVSEEKEHTDWFIVPSLLKDHSSKEELACFLARKSQSQVRYSLKFCKSSVVHLTFHKALAAALGTWRVVTCGTKRLLYENVCVFKLIRNHAGLLEQRKDSGTIELRVINLQPRPVERDPADEFRRFVESVVIHEFRRFRYHKEENDKPFVRAYRCNHTDHGPEGGSQLTDFKEDEEIMCPDNITHDSFDYKRAHAEWSTKYTDDEVYPKMKLSDKALSQLAQKAISTNWNLLGLQLGVEKAEIDHIEEQNKPTQTKIFAMLRKWKDIYADKATLDVLVEEINKCPAVTIYRDELRNIRDDYRSKQGSQEIDFTQPLSNKIIKVNKTLTLECEITKSNVSVVWLKDGETIRQDGRTTISSDGRLHKLVVDNVTAEDAAKYKCTYGTSITECFVKIEDPHGPLKFITELADKEVGVIPSTVTFLCELNKSQTQVEWYCRSQRLHPSSKYAITDDGSTHMLKIEDVSENDEGTYSVLANGLRSDAILYIEDTVEEIYLLTQHRIKQRDFSKAKEVCKKLKVGGGVHVVPSQIPVSTGVIVTNIPEDITHDAVEVYFENTRRSQGGEIQDVEIKAEDGYCLVFFKDANVVGRVCQKKDHKLHGRHVDVKPYNEYLGLPLGQESLAFKLPEPLSLKEEDQHKIKFLKFNDSQRSTLERELAKCKAQIFWDDDPVSIECTFTKDDKPKRQILQSWSETALQRVKHFTDVLVVNKKAVDMGIWSAIRRELGGLHLTHPDGVALIVEKENEQIILVGHKEMADSVWQDVVGAIATAEKKEKEKKETTTEEKELSEWRIAYLKSADFANDMHDTHKNVKLRFEERKGKGKLFVTGPKQNVADVWIAMYETLENVKQREIELDKEEIELLQNETTRGKVKQKMKK